MTLRQSAARLAADWHSIHFRLRIIRNAASFGALLCSAGFFLSGTKPWLVAPPGLCHQRDVSLLCGTTPMSTLAVWASGHNVPPQFSRDTAGHMATTLAATWT